LVGTFPTRPIEALFREAGQYRSWGRERREREGKLVLGALETSGPMKKTMYQPTHNTGVHWGPSSNEGELHSFT